MPYWSEQASAKINLTLHVMGRRPDGYHDLESLVTFAAYGDRLDAFPCEDVMFETHGVYAPMLGDPSHNLALRAAKALRERFNISQGVRLTLHKALPVGAGLGGGSADAAAALRLLCRVWQLNPRPEELATLALDLGSDVPVCLRGASAWMTGRGERLTPVALPARLPCVLAYPGTPLSTAEVFKLFTGPYSAAGQPPGRLDTQDTALRYLAHARNDLEATAAARMPAITAVLEALRSSEGCALARMSGSGSACVGIFGTSAHCETAAETIGRRHPAWWVRATTLTPPQEALKA